MALTDLFGNPVVKRGIGAAIALPVLFATLVYGMSRLAQAQGDYARAAMLPGGTTDGAALYADALLKSGDRDGADLMARRAMAASLANPRALSILGEIRADTDENAAAALYGASGLWSWRDSPAQFWLMRAKLTMGDFPGALQHADALMRRNQLRLQLFAMLTKAAAASPPAAKDMVPFFEARPLWRAVFFNSTYEPTMDLTGVQAILFALAKSEAPPSDLEVRQTVRNMISRKHPGAALVWARFHPGEKLENP